MKRLVWTLCLTMGLTDSLSALSTADYVQEGLVTHFDAIENVAAGQPHANDATVWKDLKGNASITLKTGASWTDTAFVSSQTQHEIENMPAYHRGSMSFEVTVSDVQNGKQPNTSNQWPRFFAEGEYFSIHFTNAGSQPCLYMRRASGTTGDGRLYGDDFRTGTIGMFSNSERFGLVLNGKINRETEQLPTVATPRAATKWTLNGYSGWLSGNYRALRFYNRPLTADELHQNYVIDQIRFWNTYPQGYRQQDGVLQQCVRVKASANGVVTVDGNTLSADFEVWAPFKTAATYTLTAEPKEGYLFTGWQGDTDCIISGSAGTRSITVSRAFAMTLEPQFIAIPTPVMAEPVITVHVEKDQNVKLADWLKAQNITPGAEGTFVKEGEGSLWVESDIIKDFKGEIVVKKGRWFARTRTGVGTRDASGGAIWVEDGATLQIYCNTKISNTEEARKAYQISRRVYLSGTGWNDCGALIGNSGLGADTEVYYALPSSITLLGDAKLGMYDHVNLNGLEVDLNRFTATVIPYHSNWLRLSGDWKNGQIEVTTKPLILEQPSLSGGPENTIRFKKGSGYRANGYAAQQMDNVTHGTWSPHGRWTAVFEDGAMFYGPHKTGTALGWNGPIVLDGHTTFTSQDPWAKFLFYGPISGSGDLGFNTDPANVKYGCLTLANRHNTFTGGIYLKRNALTAEYNGSIPAAGGAISAYDSSLYLKAAERYDLPDLTLTGTGLVYSAAATTGAFRHVTKSDATTVTWNTKVGASSFTLNAGTLAFGALSVSSGKIAVDLGCFSASKGAQLDLAGNAWTCTNLTGAATLLNGTLTVNGPWTLDAGTAGTLGGDTSSVTFGEKAELILDNLSGLDRSTRYTLAASTVPFTTIPPVKSLSDDRWQVRLSSDGRRLELSYSKGTTVLLR